MNAERWLRVDTIHDMWKGMLAVAVLFVVWPVTALVLLGGLSPWGRLPRRKVALACAVLSLGTAAWCAIVLLAVWRARGWW